MCTISKDIGMNKEKGICLPNKESIRDHRFGGTNMAYQCGIFKVVSLKHCGHYTRVYSCQSSWHKCRKQNMSAREGIHKCSLMNKYGWQMFTVDCIEFISQMYTYIVVSKLLGYLFYLNLQYCGVFM